MRDQNICVTRKFEKRRNTSRCKVVEYIFKFVKSLDKNILSFGEKKLPFTLAKGSRKKQTFVSKTGERLDDCGKSAETMIEWLKLLLIVGITLESN